MKVGSLFLDMIPFENEATLSDYKQTLLDISNKYTNHLSISSSRFTNPHQAYLALGSYPYFLEGQDSILLLSKKRLTVFPKIAGDFELDFESSTLFSDAKLKIFHNQTDVSTVVLRKADKPEDYSSFFQSNIISNLFPNRMIKGGTWKKSSLKLSLKPEDSISFICETEIEGCFINEFSFWKRTNSLSKNQNVIFILIDTLRFDALDSEHAPFLHKMKTQSKYYENALGAGNMTSISTNALLSCQAPSKIGSISFGYGISKEAQNKFYETNKLSFSRLLQTNKVKTAMIGNISIISEILGIGVNHGFSKQISIEGEGYETAHITKAAVNWIQENGKDPFFLYLHLNSPHAPYRAPLHDIFATIKGFDSFISQRKFLLSLYQAEIRYVDRYLQVISDSIKKLGLDENTVIIINSDHGDSHELRHYVENEAGHDYKGTLFDHVGTILYNDVIHVPLLISLPLQSKFEKFSEYVTSLDIGPTILNLFNIKTPEWCDGISLFSKDKLKTRSVVGSEGENQRAIVLKNRYKYIKSYGSSEKRLVPDEGYLSFKGSIFIKEQLFDLENDPNELTNLVSNRTLLHTLRNAFNSYYSINDSADLIIDNPSNDSIEVILSQVDRDSLPSDLKFVLKGSDSVLRIENEKRFHLHFSKLPSHLPKIKVGEKELVLTYTSMKLPFISLQSLEKLPQEDINLDQIPYSKSATAYIIRTRNDQALHRQLSFGNTSFEQIFKEWGYLVEDN